MIIPNTKNQYIDFDRKEKLNKTKSIKFNNELVYLISPL